MQVCALQPAGQAGVPCALPAAWEQATHPAGDSCRASAAACSVQVSFLSLPCTQACLLMGPAASRHSYITWMLPCQSACSTSFCQGCLYMLSRPCQTVHNWPGMRSAVDRLDQVPLQNWPIEQSAAPQQHWMILKLLSHVSAPEKIYCLFIIVCNQRMCL